MKKTFVISVILFSFLAGKAQNQNEINGNPYEKNNEVTLNLFSPLMGAVEVSYERHLNKKSSLGSSFFYVYDTKLNPDLNYYASPYYRMYFGKKYSSGFFVEGFGVISSIDGDKVFGTEDKSTFTEKPDVFDLSLGVGLGGKWVTKGGLIYGANLGWGKQLFNSDKTDHDQVVKFGINLGYRF
ncbi:DUF3575 domain-containing protein [Flavobacterium amniphilum]|uniref:DUF3575 domain-containing protein n=1 Tax=Flavobacterium amniphilum TaxID=1834035 RepID=UPI002029CA0E|nr:DUF3575 domain-containing protein [Flavobacterium amniphilum]MCL9804945.1 DUF3575 domain-containing protein [Flavobacterium amniphilum]